jgi:tetratricopeptide (TPR) repeat protein
MESNARLAWIKGYPRRKPPSVHSVGVRQLVWLIAILILGGAFFTIVGLLWYKSATLLVVFGTSDRPGTGLRLALTGFMVATVGLGIGYFALAPQPVGAPPPLAVGVVCLLVISVWWLWRVSKREDAALCFDRGKEAASGGDWSRAIQEFTATIQLNPRHILAYLSRALAAAEMQNWMRVVDDCATAIELQPDLAAAYQLRAIGYEKLGESNRAQADRTMAVLLQKDST